MRCLQAAPPSLPAFVPRRLRRRAERHLHDAAARSRTGPPAVARLGSKPSPTSSRTRPGCIPTCSGQDVRYTFRTLRRSRGFAVTAVIVAALGIGATTASFSVADHVLVRPLPFPGAASPRAAVAGPDLPRLPAYGAVAGEFPRLEKAATSLDGMAAYTSAVVNLVGAGRARRLTGRRREPATSSRSFGVQAALGRALVAAPTTSPPHAGRGVERALWRAEFGADASVLGATDHARRRAARRRRRDAGRLRVPVARAWSSGRRFGSRRRLLADRSDTYLTSSRG